MAEAAPNTVQSPWPRRWAWILAGLTFPLLWVGGLVTSTDAGMAVPDWPSTYGYNMFSYPWKTWLFGPWDLLAEHGHRLFASLIGLVTIALVGVVWRCDQRRWMRYLSLAALVLVLFQGVLGGLRVVLLERQLAMIHGCVGPAFFGLTAAVVAFTSRSWFAPNRDKTAKRGADARLRPLAVLLPILVYGQLVLGALVRHVLVTADPWTFAALVKFHLGMAAVVSVTAVVLGANVLRSPALADQRSPRVVRRLAWLILGVLTLQLLLGFGTWITEYWLPGWANGFAPGKVEAVRAGGWLKTHIVTAHSAGGSLLFALAVAEAAIVLRLVPASDPATAPSSAPGAVISPERSPA